MSDVLDKETITTVANSVEKAALADPSRFWNSVISITAIIGFVLVTGYMIYEGSRVVQAISTTCGVS